MMKKMLRSVLVTFSFSVCFSIALGQSFDKMSFQAVIRNTDNQLVTNQIVGIQISILQGSESGTAIYVERQTPSTNTNGLVSMEIGGGTIISGDFESIDWENGPFFIHTETDPNGGTDYSISGTSQLLSVPYALFAKTSGSSLPGPEGPAGADGHAPDGTIIGQILYWNGSSWVNLDPGTDGQVLTLVNGVPAWKEIESGGENWFEDVISPATGQTWMDRNLGASQVATSINDEDAYGDLYQWGRGTDGHEKRSSETTNTTSDTDNPGHGFFILNPGGMDNLSDWRIPQNDNLWQGVDGVNNPCPAGYRVPTIFEWLYEQETWISGNSAGAFASPLKLTAAGGRDGAMGGYLAYIGIRGYYWSSTPVLKRAHSLFFSIDYTSLDSPSRSSGFSVRCIKD
jgi:uncharacterized protein (TIGR02145 family)